MELERQQINQTGLLTTTKAGTVTVNATANDSSGVAGEYVITITVPIVPMPGDVNLDGKISIGDLTKTAAGYGKTSSSTDWNDYKAADLNNDGKIDIVDLAAIAKLILE